MLDGIGIGMLCDVADRKATLLSMAESMASYGVFWQMLCQGVADRITTLL